jgi:hypothetical protein
VQANSQQSLRMRSFTRHDCLNLFYNAVHGYDMAKRLTKRVVSFKGECSNAWTLYSRDSYLNTPLLEPQAIFHC